MRTIDTVLEILDAIMFRKFAYWVIYLINLSDSESQCTTENLLELRFCQVLGFQITYRK